MVRAVPEGNSQLQAGNGVVQVKHILLGYHVPVPFQVTFSEEVSPSRGSSMQVWKPFALELKTELPIKSVIVVLSRVQETGKFFGRLPVISNRTPSDVHPPQPDVQNSTPARSLEPGGGGVLVGVVVVVVAVVVVVVVVVLVIIVVDVVVVVGVEVIVVVAVIGIGVSPSSPQHSGLISRTVAGPSTHLMVAFK